MPSWQQAAIKYNFYIAIFVDLYFKQLIFIIVLVLILVNYNLLITLHWAFLLFILSSPENSNQPT